MSNISSMTGYANAKVQTDMGLLSIDMRSVNSRFLDLSFRASEEIRFLEPKFREIISGKIARGKMECRLNLVDSGLSADTALNEEALNKLMALQTQVLKTDPSATAPARRRHSELSRHRRRSGPRSRSLRKASADRL